MVKEITDEDFKEEVLNADMPVVVDFWAPWCAPCHIIAPIAEKLANEYEGKVKFCKINVEDNQKTAMEYEVMSIPLLLFFNGGKKVDFILGAVPEDSIRDKLEALL